MNPDPHTPAFAIVAATPTEPYPRSWMQPFLDSYTASGHLEQAADQLGVNAQNVRFQVEHHPAFAKAFAAAQAAVAKRLTREHRQRVRAAGLPKAIPHPLQRSMHPAIAKRLARQGEPTVSAADFCHFAGNSHAAGTIIRAELDTLSLFITRIAEAAGVEDIDGLPLTAWYMAERPRMLERQLLDIGDTDPDLAAYLEAYLKPFRNGASSNSMLRPSED